MFVCCNNINNIVKTRFTTMYIILLHSVNSSYNYTVSNIFIMLNFALEHFIYCFSVLVLKPFSNSWGSASSIWVKCLPHVCMWHALTQTHNNIHRWTYTQMDRRTHIHTQRCIPITYYRWSLDWWVWSRLGRNNWHTKLQFSNSQCLMLFKMITHHKPLIYYGFEAANLQLITVNLFSIIHNVQSDMWPHTHVIQMVNT